MQNKRFFKKLEEGRKLMIAGVRSIFTLINSTPNPDHFAPIKAHTHIGQFIINYWTARLQRIISCPLTNKIMQDPVISTEGITYERSAYEEYCRNNNTISEKFHSSQLNNLRPNLALKTLIDMLQNIPQPSTPSQVRAHWINNLDISLRCQISADNEIMDTAVVAADGFSYQHSNICAWFKTHPSIISPMTNTPLANSMLVPNLALRNIIGLLREIPHPNKENPQSEDIKPCIEKLMNRYSRFSIAATKLSSSSLPLFPPPPASSTTSTSTISPSPN